jgi:DNA-binding transcriptional LysR family regulator
MKRAEFAELSSFAAVAERGNFTRAAAHLGVTPSALSQTIRRLEDRVGVRLLNRTTRSVAPSEAGKRLLARLLPTLDELDAAVADIAAVRDRPSGTLRINAPRIAAELVVAPMLAGFTAAYPDVTLELVVEDALVDIVAGGYDAGIRLGALVARDMIAVPVSGPLRTHAVATPAYLARAGRPRHPRDLLAHRCIVIRMPRGERYRWEFERDGKTLEIPVEGPVVTNNTSICLRAALDGVGIAFLFDLDLEPHLASGALEIVLESWSPPFPGLYLYYPSRRQAPPALRAFVAALGSPRLQKASSARPPHGRKR